MILDQAKKQPHAVALDDGTRQRSFAELVDRSQRVARFLRGEAGLNADDHVAVLMQNRVETIEVLLGGVMAGVWVTPINWHLASDEIAYVVADSGARVLFCDDHHASQAESVAAAARETKVAVQRVGEEWERLLGSVSDAPVDLEGPAGGNMIYTSGTTGRPKGVKRARARSVIAALEQHCTLGQNVGLDGAGPHLVTGPAYHAAPLMFAVYDNANGAPILMMPRWDAEEALTILAEREVAHTHLVPTMFVRLLQLPEERRLAFSAPKLELVLHGAAPISVAVKQRMIEWWGPKLVEYWGGTEGGVNTLIDSEEWLAHPGSVGRALPSFEILAVDDRGEKLPPGEVGDLYCRHRTLDRAFEYHEDEEKTAGAYLEPGVFTIGDIGKVDPDGHVYLSDRRSNMIISGGVNIYPAEIEQVLQEHPAVGDVAVFGIPDDEWGESVKACVELLPGHSASDALVEELRAFARQHLAGYKVPRSVDFEAELPRHPSGKLYVRRLRERYWQGRDRRI